MAENKRYFWLKLYEGFFRQKEIKKLRKEAGDTCVIIYLKMLLKSLSSNGMLFFDGVESNFVEEVALDIDEDEDKVAVTVQFLMKQGILVKVSEEEYLLTTCEDMVGSETESAKRVRKHRKKLEVLQSNGSALQCNTDVTECNTEIDIEKDLEEELEEDIENNQSINQEDAIDKIDAYTKLIKENIEYDYLLQDYPTKTDVLEELLNILVETVSVTRKSIRISNADYPYELVKGTFMKLNMEHIKYVIDSMGRNTTKIRNIKSYLLTALYNAPNTIGNYYQAEVNHDMYGMHE